MEGQGLASTALVDRTCAECGAAFVGRWRALWCSPECRGVASLRQRRATYPTFTATCTRCEATFVTSDSRRRYCTRSCWRRSHAHREGDRYRRLYKRAGRTIECLCGKVFTQPAKGRRKSCSEECTQERKRKNAIDFIIRRTNQRLAQVAPLKEGVTKRDDGYWCPSCEQEFTTHPQLRVHVSVTHGRSLARG